MNGPEPSPSSTETFFAPAGRLAPAALREQIEAICGNPIATFLLNSLNGLVAILNEQRQILAASPDLIGALGTRWDGPMTGARPGEAFECIHTPDGPNGCGTAQACSHCGLLQTFLEALEGDAVTEGDWRLALQREGRYQAVEFHVVASPLAVGGHRFLAITFHDISAEKHRDALERLFFHDIGNILQGLQGWSESLSEGITRPEEAARRILHISERLSAEVQSHRRLLQAERGLLTPAPDQLDGEHLLHEVLALLERHPSGHHRHLETCAITEGRPLLSDPDLLLRVLYNMALNALEASGREEIVTLTFQWQGPRARFAVHNPGAIPKAIQHQIFHRSFSTKASRGRGLGTYAMKLFGENVLRGQVGFDSAEAAGTTFWITLPASLEGA